MEGAKTKFTMDEIGALLDAAKQQQEMNSQMFDITMELRMIRVILEKKFGITDYTE